MALILPEKFHITATKFPCISSQFSYISFKISGVFNIYLVEEIPVKLLINWGISGPPKRPAFNFSVRSPGNMWEIHWKQSLFFSKASAICFNILNLNCKGGNMIFFSWNLRFNYHIFFIYNKIRYGKQFSCVPWLDLARLSKGR